MYNILYYIEEHLGIQYCHIGLSLFRETLTYYFQNHVSIMKGKPQHCHIGFQ